MTAWSIIVLLTIPVVGYLIYRFFIKSLIMKWKANPKMWFDLLIGILIACAALVALVLIFLKQAGIIDIAL